MDIAFHFQKKTTLADRLKLKTFIVSIFQTESTLAESCNFILCDDTYLLEINRSFLQHDYFTDIITFNLAAGSMPIEGEVYISIDTVFDNALRFGTTRSRELHRVIFHGVLHLCGYKDKTKRDQKLMSAMEEKYLQFYFGK